MKNSKHIFGKAHRLAIPALALGLTLGLTACSSEAEKRRENEARVNATTTTAAPIRDMDTANPVEAPIRPMPNGTMSTMPGDPVGTEVPGTTTGMTSSGSTDPMVPGEPSSRNVPDTGTSGTIR